MGPPLIKTPRPCSKSTTTRRWARRWEAASCACKSSDSNSNRMKLKSQFCWNNEPAPWQRILFQLLSIILFALLLTVGTTSTQAASGSWTVDADGNWSDTTKWAGGVVANGAGNTAIFNLVVTAFSRTVTLNASHTLGSLVFGNSSSYNGNNWTISGANTITLSSGSVPTLTCWPLKSSGNSACTLNSALSGTQGFTELGSGTLWLAGNNSGLSGTLAISAGRVFRTHR